MLNRCFLPSLSITLLVVPFCADASELWPAAKKGDLVAIERLLAAGADVNAATKYGATALIFAADRGHLEVAKKLIAAGANVNVKDKFYQATPLGWAAGSGHGEIVRLLLKHGAEGAKLALRTASGEGSVSVAKAVLEQAKIDQQYIADCRNLAADLGHRQVSALLVDALADTDLESHEVAIELLESYVGSYQSEQGREYEIECKGGKLKIRSPGREAVSLRAADNATFKFFETTYKFSTKDEVVQFTRRAGARSEVFRRQPVDSPSTKEVKPSTDAPLSGDSASSSGNWPQFRGTGARGIADGSDAPTAWDVEKSVGVRWKAPIAGLAHSCPIVWGDRVFVTTAESGEEATLRTGLYGDVESVDEESSHQWQVFCLDLKTGKQLWKQVAHEGEPTVGRHPKSTHANPTPATNGKQVVASFGSEGLYCYSMDGRLLWKKLLGDLDSGWFYDKDRQWGFASSPIIFENRVIVQCDVQQGSYVAAFEIETGEELWRTERDEIPTWSTPTVAQTPRGPLLITNGTQMARGYDARDGQELWRLTGHSEIAVPTPFVAHDLIFVASGYRPIQPIYAIRLDARGDISLKDGETTSQHIAWSQQRGGPYLPTPLVYGDWLYVLGNSGILTCHDAKTGERKYQKRVRGGGAKSFSASLVAADGVIYCTSEEGVVLVVAAGPEFELLYVNPVDDYCLATPAITSGCILLRTQKHLIAVGR